MNYLRSKAISSIGARTLVAEQGVFTNTRSAYVALQQTRGFVEYAEGASPESVQRTQIIDNATAPAVIEMMRDDQRELEGMGGTNDAVVEGPQAQMSGIAVQSMQAQAALEMEPIMLELRHLSLRCARQVWGRIRQSWTAEKIVRVTGRDGSDEFVRVNAQVPMAEKIAKESGRDVMEVAQMMLQRGMDPDALVTMDSVAEMDVDVVLDSAPDEGTLLEQKQTLLQQTLPAWSNVLPKRTANRLLLESIPNLENRAELIQEAMAAIDQEEQSSQMQMELDGQKAQLEQQMLQAQIQAQVMNSQAEAANFQSAAEQKQHEMKVAEFDLQRQQQEFQLKLEEQQASIIELVQSMGAKLELIISQTELNRAKAAKTIVDAQPPQPDVAVLVDDRAQPETEPMLMGEYPPGF